MKVEQFEFSAGYLVNRHRLCVFNENPWFYGLPNDYKERVAQKARKHHDCEKGSLSCLVGCLSL